MGRSSEMAFLEGQICARKETDEDEDSMVKIKKTIRLIDESLKKHI